MTSDINGLGSVIIPQGLTQQGESEYFYYDIFGCNFSISIIKMLTTQEVHVTKMLFQIFSQLKTIWKRKSILPTIVFNFLFLYCLHATSPPNPYKDYKFYNLVTMANNL